MQVWNVLHADRWKYRTQKIAKNSPSAHHRTTSGCIFTTMAYIDSRKKHVKQQYVSSQYGELTNGWDRCGSLGHPSKFQRVSRLVVFTAPTSLNGGQLNIARCLAVSWAGTLCIGFIGGALARWRNFARCKIQTRLSLAFSYIGIVTARHSNSGRQPNFAAFSRGRHLYSAGGHHVGHWPTF